jgi:hypothetical protein
MEKIRTGKKTIHLEDEASEGTDDDKGRKLGEKLTGGETGEGYQGNEKR